MSIFNIKWFIIAIVFTALLVSFMHLPEEPVPILSQQGGLKELEELQHILAYGIITLLFILSIKIPFISLSGLILLFAVLAIGTIDEIIQPLCNRTASLAY